MWPIEKRKDMKISSIIEHKGDDVITTSPQANLKPAASLMLAHHVAAWWQS